ncbi:ArsR/SmtB family transcription factor [Amycolatopsis nigrescens]|uniref:ArsR/SmtB family transcription factor n=1 Tax=Amycolatopsis nigrescens TaxID=381445 RepID=UPI00037FBD94|nr:metalloregulator ArsR/SmtB family transcription factor [Amycolatopsis nigrescens]
MTDEADRNAAMFRALGHPVRLGIMRQLAREPETCACDFAEVFGVSQPTISQHLKVLREAGLVTTRRRGTQICYSVHPGGLDQLDGLLSGLRPVPLAEVG